MRGHVSSCHKDNYCKMISPTASTASESADTEEAASQAKKGTLEAILPRITTSQRKELHRRITLWLVRRKRPLTLPENDSEFRDIFDFIFAGGYVPPTYKLVMQQMLELSSEGKENVRSAMDLLEREVISPSLAGDIWSEGGISIFGVLTYWIDVEFTLFERLVSAIPFSAVRHTASEIQSATKKACSDMHIGLYREDLALGDGVDTVDESVHCTISDNASNIISGWDCFFDGYECCNHTLALIVKAFLEHPDIQGVFKKLRGMTTHFNHSVIGGKLLNDCQKRHNMNVTKPPHQDNDTRTGWGGACKQATWYMRYQVVIQMYDIENPVNASTAVPNPDGSVYKDHRLDLLEWYIVKESAYFLTYVMNASNILQGTTKYPTASLILPVLGKVAHYAEATTPLLKFENAPVEITNESVIHGRKLLLTDFISRYFNGLQDCKLEDWCIATVLDPRYKHFTFHCG
ncbi:hypothetical protein CYMTET_34337 [Cymbomonas tetramitiformis]|uniref:Uncharacterized protein n=1 Tax=Cymbomonas tetramitiformis TaxID=36881 RepID=A0AAE0KQ23_9CHLO|nr:hypothetical protein CYMTET_34337 [Cymbomonas tetramitiformis]